ncbi:FecR family protein [Niabella drilacis]|uniref:FecR family protein n=1 Tax=Niabella drilacis (strain DSM 25811 / CCM 8410 / CCUG 62505 / LMG 26954 / E90) TaxID=1285928 RepID=A0A1G6L4H6_NIADE|nr:FecR family protein [Niabella drilacis]SDC38114.1 FecR family protein [Niabella drilacis]
MPLSKERIIYLLDAYTAQKATSQEEEELLEWLQHSQEDVVLKDYVQKLWNGHTLDQTFDQVNWDRIFDTVISPGGAAPAAPRGRRLLMHWRGVAAAVAILAILSTGFYFAFFKKDTGPQPVALLHDVKAPQTNRATLTLSNGQQVYLDSLTKGALVNQGGVHVLKLADGRIIYKGAASEVLYNTLTNPRGSKVIDMILSDGTHIWLNSGSSIRYPAAFVGNERKVSITGEAYFEVAHDPEKPFKVVLPSFSGVQGGEITVLGTHFNVNAYDDENAIRTTLLEGSVLLNLPSSSPVKPAARLRPGQQARITDNLVISNNSNLEEVMAWKNDRFDFGEKTDIETLMRQLARWYDIDVHYAGKITAHFGGSISRQVNVSGVLKLLEATGGAKFRIEGKTVTIMP